VENGDGAWEGAVVAAHHVLSLRDRSVVATGTYDDEWHRAHEGFHAALLAACPSSRLTDMATALRAEGELYRQWAERSPRTYERDVPAEHRALLDAALARHAQLAARLMREHISLTARILLGDPGLLLADVQEQLSS
jgi:DNA-binding GntR family transcriptional regulator